MNTIKITFNKEEIESSFACRLQELGLAGIDPSTIHVTFKSPRTGEQEAEVEFAMTATRIPVSPQPTATASELTGSSSAPEPDTVIPVETGDDINTGTDTGVTPKSTDIGNDSIDDIFSGK